jgi:hypothetical protein
MLRKHYPGYNVSLNSWGYTFVVDLVDSYCSIFVYSILRKGIELDIVNTGISGVTGSADAYL